jgi:general secretion pathway protein G
MSAFAADYQSDDFQPNLELMTDLDAQIEQQARRYTARPGFSMIELVAVLVILGLLMAGAAVAVPKQINRARVRVTKTSMVTIKTVINTYMADNAGDAPPSLIALIPTYLETGSELDAWQKPFHYIATPGGNHAYELISLGKDKQPGTNDDINLWTMDVTNGTTN